MISVVVAGALGKMGRETVRAVRETSDLTLAGAVDVRAKDHRLLVITGDARDTEPIRQDLNEALDELKPQVMIDFTNPQAVFPNCRAAIRRGIHCVVGTTGLGPKELSDLDHMARENKVGVAVIPNFAIGAVLMMRFAREAASYFNHVEILELHHDGKVDAPSGTAVKTAEMIAETRKVVPQDNPEAFEKYPGCRGGKAAEVRIHSVRLPGLVAHQEVIFGDKGQTLTIRHDSLSRECFMPGVILVTRSISRHTGLVYGLEPFLG